MQMSADPLEYKGGLESVAPSGRPLAGQAGALPGSIKRFPGRFKYLNTAGFFHSVSARLAQPTGRRVRGVSPVLCASCVLAGIRGVLGATMHTTSCVRSRRGVGQSSDTSGSLLGYRRKCFFRSRVVYTRVHTCDACSRRLVCFVCSSDRVRETETQR